MVMVVESDRSVSLMAWVTTGEGTWSSGDLEDEDIVTVRNFIQTHPQWDEALERAISLVGDVPTTKPHMTSSTLKLLVDFCNSHMPARLQEQILEAVFKIIGTPSGREIAHCWLVRLQDRVAICFHPQIQTHMDAVSSTVEA